MNCSKACGPTNDSNPAAAVLASCCNCDSPAIVGAYADVFICLPTKGSIAFKKFVSDASSTGAGLVIVVVVILLQSLVQI